MSKFVLRDAVITVNSVNLSDHCSSVEIEDEADDVEFTAFGVGGYKEYGQGLKDATITLSVFSDYAAASVDATLFPLYDSGGTFPVSVKATSAATSGSNPIYNMTGRLYSYSPISGDVGDAATSEVAIRNAGTAGLTRATS